MGSGGLINAGPHRCLEIPLTWRASARAYRLPNFERRDPADRLLVATAVEIGCPLVTYDAPLSHYAAGAGRQIGLLVIG
jgi:PIN domain nuclease of toxin-antitoxin system